MKRQNRGKVAIIINSASYDRVVYALSIAATSTLFGNEVHVLFTYGAVRRLVKGKADQIGEETDSWVRDDIKTGLEKDAIPQISETLTTLSRFGGKVYACVGAMALHNIVKDDLADEVNEVTSISAFLEKTNGASTVLYI